MVRWIFDELPPSGARRGGDPSTHVFRPDVAPLEREVVQNANDQAVSWPRLRFRFIELSGERLAEFQAAMGWSTLLPHLVGAARSKTGHALSGFLEGVETSKRLMLLSVEDHNTMGLIGAETEGDSHFRALCKDTLYSHKTNDGAGGSYGLGKSVLWTFSGLSTVLFNSVLLQHLPGQRSPRLIGRTELPSHEVEGSPKWYGGSGWLGEPRLQGGLHAESVWGEDADALAESLFLKREDLPGTSILIVGFRDPTSEGNDEVQELVSAVRGAAARYFWPAMMMEGRRLRLTVGGEQEAAELQIEDEPTVMPFVECYRRRHEPSVDLEQPGDVVVRRIAVDLPDRRDGTKAPPAEVDLVVRLAAPRDDASLVGHVAMFRGPGMVVRYWDRRGMSLAARPFHAALVCGAARNPRQPSEGDREVERFLRAAEPPGHDAWLSTAPLKQTYKRGYATCLKRLEDRVTEELRSLLVARPTQGDKGPDRLQRRFPIGGRGAPGGTTSAFRFRGLDAFYDGDRWRFSGSIEPTERQTGWSARLSLHEADDDGRATDPIAIGDLTTQGESQVTLAQGVAEIRAADGVRALTFRGESEALPASWIPSEVVFEVTGALAVEGRS